MLLICAHSGHVQSKHFPFRLRAPQETHLSHGMRDEEKENRLNEMPGMPLNCDANIRTLLYAFSFSPEIVGDKWIFSYFLFKEIVMPTPRQRTDQ